MPRTCAVCPHPHREEIDRRLLEGTPLRNIAKQFRSLPLVSFATTSTSRKHCRMLARKPKSYVRTA
jgi:hypothetical protein